MKLKWFKIAYSNEGGRWIEWHTVSNGMRCSRTGRTYFSIWEHIEGKDWHDLPVRKQVKLTMEDGRIIDVGLPPKSAAQIERYLTFAFQCICDSDAKFNPADPIHRLCASRLKQMACKFNFYEKSHPGFGLHFQGENPDVSVSLLITMIKDAITSKSVRITGASSDFDPKD